MTIQNDSVDRMQFQHSECSGYIIPSSTCIPLPQTESWRCEKPAACDTPHLPPDSVLPSLYANASDCNLIRSIATPLVDCFKVTFGRGFARFGLGPLHGNVLGFHQYRGGLGNGLFLCAWCVALPGPVTAPQMCRELPQWAGQA